MLTKNYIQRFLNKIHDKYPDLIIGYSYNKDEDYYSIWHTDEVLQFENDEFLNYVGDLIRHLFYNNNIYNISFGYNYEKDIKYNTR